ncbi:MAG TPA: hypothetical protein VFI24_06615 [Pyrinomonadaceae bacterium]|nr:hypothetical protein [Pyrinomonadaceae bacterium]
MSDEDLEVLVTLDNPWYGPDEDIFHHCQDVSAFRHKSHYPQITQILLN